MYNPDFQFFFFNEKIWKYWASISVVMEGWGWIGISLSRSSWPLQLALVPTILFCILFKLLSWAQSAFKFWTPVGDTNQQQ